MTGDVINMARIRVAGVGGLGLVAMALFVAFNVPRIGQSMTLGFALGAVFAVILILRRRHQGPMPSSGQSLGANTVLSIDVPRADERDVGDADKTETTPPPIRRRGRRRPFGNPEGALPVRSLSIGVG
jgi:hypothetical protein